MDTGASQRETREPLWLRLAHHGFAALVVGSAVLLAAGGAPSWVERTAVVFLWTLVVLFYLGMAIAFMSYRMPAPETLRQHAADGGQHRRGGSRIKRAVRRLFHLFLVAALAISGRPVLAGLYLLAPFTGVAVDVGRKRWIEGVERPDVSAGRWAVYQVFRHAFRAIPWVLRAAWQVVKWGLWTPLLAAVAACLWHADIRLKRPLRRALGLPQALTRMLYGRPYRALWQRVLPAAFWLAMTALALGLATGVLPATAMSAVTTLLWGTAIALLPLAAVSLLVLFWPDIEASIAHRPRPAGWPRSPRPYLMGLLRLVFLVALCVANAWVLAALYLGLICVVTALAFNLELETRTDWGEDTYIFPPVAGLIGLLLVVTPLAVAALPVIAPYLAFRFLVSDRRTARRLREAHAMADGLVYFLYAAPHQRAHFLDEGGLLHRWRERVVARDWRTDIKAVRSDLGWEAFMASPEGRLLDRFEISNMREHLPFLAVVTRRRLRAFRLAKAYRVRRRDGGKALGELERRIGKWLVESFAGVPS